MDLHDLLASVSDEATFVAFVKALGDDFDAFARRERGVPSSAYEPTALGWENISIGDFLRSASAWAQDSTDEMRARSSNPWQRCAAILLMGKHYE